MPKQPPPALNTSAATPFDHELKLSRAREHLANLQVKVVDWLNGNHHTVRNEVDPKDGRTVFFASADQVPPDPFSLLIGDCLHNLRSSLDLLAFALARAHTNPLPDDIAESSEFPIFGDEDRQGNMGIGSRRFNQLTKGGSPAHGSGLHKIRGIDPRAQVEIERLQPYHRGNAYRTHPLSLLHDLDRINKHRLLHVVTASFGGVGLDTRNSKNWQLTPGILESLSGPITTDTPIARIPVAPVDPNHEMKVEIQPAINMAFAKGTAGEANAPVLETLAEIYNFVVADVLPKLSPFL